MFNDDDITDNIGFKGHKTKKKNQFGNISL